MNNSIEIQLDQVAPEFMRFNWQGDENRPSHIGFRIGENYPEVFLFKTDRNDFVRLILACDKNKITIGFAYTNWQAEAKEQLFATYEITGISDDLDTVMRSVQKKVSDAFVSLLKTATPEPLETPKNNETPRNNVSVLGDRDTLAANDIAGSAPGRVKTIAAVAIPFFLIAGGFLYFNNNKDPLVIDNGQVQMTEQAFNEQVELTKATLKAMGLDPGASGDVGCLAPQ